MNPERYLSDFVQGRMLRYALSVALIVVASFTAKSIIPYFQTTRLSDHSYSPPQPRPDPMAIAARVASAHLFGKDASQASGNMTAITQANVAVEGVLYSGDKDTAWAILTVDGTSGLFKTGDALPDGEKVTAIGERAVQLSNGSSQRVLELQQAFGNDVPGILLAGDTGLTRLRDPLLGGPVSKQPAYTSALRAVSLPQNSDPLSQLRALREQLIKH